jgi:superfamily II DNA/RNA helicase
VFPGKVPDNIDAFDIALLPIALARSIKYAHGINLQFCWIMVNYDIPWNPARLEQRMGRIHRYKQRHEVRIVNLVTGKTREGRVLRTLLEKLERIRRELGSDKVFDVIGRLLEGVSLKQYMEQCVTEEGAQESERKFEGTHARPSSCPTGAR